MAELRRDIPDGQIDILLKNGDIVECKNWDWNSFSPEEYDKRINRIVKQVGKFRGYNPNANIRIVFKELPASVKADIE